MVRTSGIRDQHRSQALRRLAQERGRKRTRSEIDDDSESTSDGEEKQQVESTAKSNNLLSILPKPKNSNAFGPTVRLDKLLKMPERSKEALIPIGTEQEISFDDDIVEFDASKIVSEPILNTNLGEEQPKVFVPKGKEKQKNQITYLAQLSKATELDRKEQAARGRFNKAAARAKYGW